MRGDVREDGDLDERSGMQGRGDDGRGRRGHVMSDGGVVVSGRGRGRNERVGGLDAEWLDRASQVLSQSMADEGREEASARRGR